MDLLEREYLGNAVEAWIAAGTLVALATVVLLVAKAVIARRLAARAKRTDGRTDDVLHALVRAIRVIGVLAIALYLGTRLLDLPARVGDLVQIFLTIALALQAVAWGSVLVDEWLIRHVASSTAAGQTIGYGAVRAVAMLVLWAVVVLLALDNFGIEVTALIAGLGIGGIAVALAAQNILGDVFDSLSIVLDKPFEIGDFIVVGEMMGTVESVGIKTTRLRSLGGEQLVLSNSDLVGSRIRNYKRMQERRIVFAFGVTYQTPQAELERLPATVRTLVEGVGETRFDRAHFKAFGASSLDFEVVYYVLSADFGVFMDKQQAINFALMRTLADAGIEFAYPTQTLFVAGLPDGAYRADGRAADDRADGDRRTGAATDGASGG